MDTTEQNIKMCEKAEEIQGTARWLLFTPKKLDCMVWSGEDVFFDGKDKLIWLPRQDQLQEMVWEITTNDCINQTGLLWKFINKDVMYINDNFNASMEQLWLAFVMKEKYNKTWDGENWQSTNEG